MLGENVPRKSLVEEIYASLKQEILWLRLKPGDVLAESFLASVYETSKTPVREALARLVSEGLVTVFPRAGYAVSEICFSDIKDMHEYRYVLENYCLVNAVNNATAEQIDHLDSLSYTDRYSFVDEPPIFKLQTEPIPRDSEFHIYLAEISGNKVICKQLMETLEKLQRIMFYVAENDYMTSGCEEHHILAVFLRNKRLEEAQSLLHHHINEVYEHCAKARDLQKLF